MNQDKDLFDQTVEEIKTLARDLSDKILWLEKKQEHMEDKQKTEVALCYNLVHTTFALFDSQDMFDRTLDQFEKQQIHVLKQNKQMNVDRIRKLRAYFNNSSDSNLRKIFIQPKDQS